MEQLGEKPVDAKLDRLFKDVFKEGRWSYDCFPACPISFSWLESSPLLSLSLSIHSHANCPSADLNDDGEIDFPEFCTALLNASGPFSSLAERVDRKLNPIQVIRTYEST